MHCVRFKCVTTVPSNLNPAFDERLCAHFTAAELVEFLGLSVETLLVKFPNLIYKRHYIELCDEIGHTDIDDYDD